MDDKYANEISKLKADKNMLTQKKTKASTTATTKKRYVTYTSAYKGNRN